MENKENNKEHTVPVYGVIIFSILLIWAFIHAFRTRSIEEIFSFQFSIGKVISSYSIILLIIVFFFEWVISKKLKNTLNKYIRPIYIILFLSLFSNITTPTIYVIYASIKDIFLWTQSSTHTENERIIYALTITIIIGLALFNFRLHRRSTYGATESLAGLVVAVITAKKLNTISDASFHLSLLTASIYLFVRGLDNIHQGLTKEPLDPWAVKCLNYIKNKKSTTDNSSSQ